MSKKINYIVYDLETGGFSAEKNPITEVAMIAIDGETLEETSRYTTFVQPYLNLEYDPQALKATGIDMNMIMSGKDAKVVSREVSNFITSQGTGLNKKPILCGHNIIKFDNPFLYKLLNLTKKDLYSIINKDIFIDTMWWSRLKTPVDSDSFGKHNLTSACNREGIELVDAHRAMNDTSANARLVVSYLQNLRGKGVVKSVEEKHSFRDTFKI